MEKRERRRNYIFGYPKEMGQSQKIDKESNEEILLQRIYGQNGDEWQLLQRRRFGKPGGIVFYIYQFTVIGRQSGERRKYRAKFWCNGWRSEQQEASIENREEFVWEFGAIEEVADIVIFGRCCAEEKNSYRLRIGFSKWIEIGSCETM